ncbi:MAG TPA: acyltransferase family protein, partial [Noviherbaspirillum sp.]
MPTPASSSPPASSALDSSHAYRPDVDGLRALAVLAVIAFHASATTLPGGFVGVDIFFVISGFLITGLIVKGIEGGNFSFADFYTRRIKRIFPAYMLVAMVTLVVASFLLIPNDYIFYTTSLAASWAFLSNVFFSMLSWGYFGQRTEEFPLLHTWSLSVEEQFYFLFPLVMIGLYRYLRAYVVPALVVLTLVFVTISEMKTGEVKTYFLLQSRAHELLIGALTWFLTQRAPMRSTALANFWIAAGMALMIGSMFLFNQDTPFPGINSLYPCIGAALVIYAGRTPNSLTPVLRHRVLVGIGLLSYSLYLWHWPIFSFLRYRRIELSWDVALAAVALAFVLAALTWRFIEQPVRKQRSLRFRRAFVQLYVLPAALFMSVGLYSYVTEGAPLRFPSEMRDLIASYSFERDLGRNCSIRDEDYRRIDLAYLTERCAFGDMNRGRPEVLLMGDSHAHHFKPFVEHLSHHARLKAVFHVQGSCYPTDLQASMPGLMQAGATEQSTCQRRNADLLAIAGQFRYVVLAGFWSKIPPE